MTLVPSYAYSAERAKDRPLFGGQPVGYEVLNERLDVGGHYLIVVREGSRVRVSCPDCGVRYSCVIQADAPEAASRFVDRALDRYVDKSCEGVRMQHLAELVMLT